MTVPCSIFHCPPASGPQALKCSPLVNVQPQIIRPPPPLTWAGLGCSGTDGTLAPQTGSTQLTAPGPGSIYGWPHPLLLVLRNFWKVGNASGGRRGLEREKKPKTSPKPPWLPPLCLRALSWSLGPTAPSSYQVEGTLLPHQLDLGSQGILGIPRCWKWESRV